MKQINCLLFDLDGTLLDSREAIIDAMHETVEIYAPGMFTRHTLMRRFGESFYDFLASLDYLPIRLLGKDRILETYLELLRRISAEKVQLFPGVKEGLKQLKAAGYRIAIVTNKQRSFSLEELDRCGILTLFDSIVTVDDVSEGKPSAEPVLKAMNEMGALPDQALMIGDSKYDLLAAKAAMSGSVILNWYDESGFEEYQPDYTFSNFYDFTEELLAVKTR